MKLGAFWVKGGGSHAMACIIWVLSIVWVYLDVEKGVVEKMFSSMGFEV